MIYLELISNGIHTFTELVPNSGKQFFGSFNGHLNRQKILNRKIPGKSVKSQHAHMKQIIFPSIVLEFKWLVNDGFMDENGLALTPKKEIRTPQYRKSPRNLKYSQPKATRYEKNLAPPQKKYIC